MNEIDGKVENCLDYRVGLVDFPRLEVLKYLLERGSSVVLRPSGTEPNFKIYISVATERKTWCKYRKRLRKYKRTRRKSH